MKTTKCTQNLKKGKDEKEKSDFEKRKFEKSLILRKMTKIGEKSDFEKNWKINVEKNLKNREEGRF